MVERRQVRDPGSPKCPGAGVKERLPCPGKPGSRWLSSSPAAPPAPSAGSWHPGTAASHSPGSLLVSTPLLPSGFQDLNLGKKSEDWTLKP